MNTFEICWPANQSCERFLVKLIMRNNLLFMPVSLQKFLSKYSGRHLTLTHDLNSAINFLGQLTTGPDKSHLSRHKIVPVERPILLEITPPHYAKSGIPRPQTPIGQSSLFTGSPSEPQLAHELLKEMRSADSVDILISFIKWSGLRLLMPAFEDLRDRGVRVRVITTSYMGASDAPAVEWLAGLPNVKVRVSYDTTRTRLHAKAYYFKRKSGYSTAFIGSANMSHAAMTSGLEWNLKITAQDMKFILEKFIIEFETYWNSREFIPFDCEHPDLFRTAIERARNPQRQGATVFFDLHPHPFQERILDALERERNVHNRWQNLVIAATGTGKTVIAAFDFKRIYKQQNKQVKLLFVAHRQTILQQALTTFRNVLRDQNFGELQVENHEAGRREHLFCSISMLSRRRLWEQIDNDFYDFIIIDEAHHGTADSYRPIFLHFQPKILLGLTATPERMDGGNVAADFGNRFAAEIRLPEALEEKLLCPFHYFGVSDPVSLKQDIFWRNGKYDASELEKIYTGAHALAKQRLVAILDALHRYEPDITSVKGLGFCLTIKHAKFMAEMFNQQGIPSGAIVSGLDDQQCQDLMVRFTAGELNFLFTVDKLSEGLDVPEVNVVLFLRPTESLTVFLQQLGRGLRHSPGKDCLTVLDFVGQAHRKYRLDTKLKAILPRHRFGIDKEVEYDFPHLPAGCSIQLDRLSKGYVLDNIRENLSRLAVQVPERIQTFSNETGLELTFGNFINYHDYEPELLLKSNTWSSWKALAQHGPVPIDPDLGRLGKTLVKASFINGPKELTQMRQVVGYLAQNGSSDGLRIADSAAMPMYYRIWGDKAENIGVTSLNESFQRLSQNPSIIADLDEILAWSEDTTQVSGVVPELPFPCLMELQAKYGSTDILANLGRANLETAGQRGVGVLHFPEIKAYVLLVTFQKTEREFSLSTMYADYPISRELLHWESQSTTAQHSVTGQNLIHHKDKDYTIMIFARDLKKRNGVTVPFTYLGPADLLSYESERPIKIVWRLKHPMAVEMFEENRRGG